jgi:hypothetical protein
LVKNGENVFHKNKFPAFRVFAALPVESGLTARINWKNKIGKRDFFFISTPKKQKNDIFVCAVVLCSSSNAVTL